MTKKERFIVAVQAAAIVRDIRDGRTVAGAVVANAFDISERSINGADLLLVDMVDEYIRYQYQTSPPDPKIAQPDWLMTEDEVKLWGLEEADPVELLTTLLPLSEEEADKLDEGRRRDET